MVFTCAFIGVSSFTLLLDFNEEAATRGPADDDRFGLNAKTLLTG
jgi:hypothetical protein